MDTIFQSISQCVNLLTIRRLIVIGIVFAMFTFVNMFIRYVATLFIVFCVVYTVQDLYKHRKKYLWYFNMMRNTFMLLVHYGLGDDAIQFFEKHCVTTKKKTRSKKNALN
jgi:hypothetical protein